jgi:hypothetical protein
LPRRPEVIASFPTGLVPKPARQDEEDAKEGATGRQGGQGRRRRRQEARRQGGGTKRVDGLICFSLRGWGRLGF